VDLKTLLIIYNIAVTLSIFLYAAYEDIKKREVEDKIWIILVILTLPSSLYLIGFLKLMLNFIPCFLFGILLYYVFKFGGADAKGIWSLSISLPYSPLSTIFPLMPSFPLSIVFNSIIISISYIFVNLFHNLRKYFKEKRLFEDNTPTLRKIILFLFAQKLSEEEFKKSKFYIPALKNGKLNIAADIRDFDFEKKEYICEWYEKAQPFLFYVAISIPLTMFIGDLSLGLVISLMR